MRVAKLDGNLGNSKNGSNIAKIVRVAKLHTSKNSFNVSSNIAKIVRVAKPQTYYTIFITLFEVFFNIIN